MVLEIKWWSGEMAVNLEAFLACHSINKVKKLLKAIRCSNTPECEQQIKDYVQSKVEPPEQFKIRRAAVEKCISEDTEKAEFYKKQAKICTANRDRFRRGSTGWTHYNNMAKEAKEKTKLLRASIANGKKEIDTRDREFYLKVLTILPKDG